MSQHQIQVSSPKVGQVLVTVGYDAVLDEAFLNYFHGAAAYLSPFGLAVAEIQQLALQELGIELPQQVIDAVQGDLCDLRLGATDIGRRITYYAPDGRVAGSRW